MKLNRKQKVTISLLLFLIIVGAVCFLYYLNRPRNLNVILITLDALRPDHLGLYGYKLDTSPNIDRFAKEAAVFSTCIAQGSKTTVAMPALLTSLYPRTHGIYIEGQQLNHSAFTITQVLKKNNYVTAAIVCCIKQIQGLTRDFDTFIDDGDIKADKITQRAISWLEKNNHRKFFLWLHYFDPHGPYKPPAPYNSMFVNKFNLGSRNLPIDNSGTGSTYKVIPNYVLEDNITDIDYYLSQYDGEIRFADEQIGILLRKIKELNLDKKSILIITADHGEMLGEHDYYFGHNSLYDENVKIPLLIKCKNIPATKIIQQVRQIDIVPTILAFLHIPKGRHMQGKSLLTFILGKGNHPSLDAFIEHGRHQTEPQLIRESVRIDGWKLIYYNKNNEERYELYNLNNDPKESTNLSNIEIEKFKFLKQKLYNWRQETPLFEPEIHPLKEKDRQLLKTLGYVQ